MIAALIRCVSAIFLTAIADASEWDSSKDLAKDLYNWAIISSIGRSHLQSLSSTVFLLFLLLKRSCSSWMSSRVSTVDHN